MMNLFRGYGLLQSLDLTGFDTSWAMEVPRLFADCSAATS